MLTDAIRYVAIMVVLVVLLGYVASLAVGAPWQQRYRGRLGRRA